MVTQHQTGEKKGNFWEWNVTIANPCPCAQRYVTLSCRGLNSQERIDTNVVTISNNLCFINSNTGADIAPFSQVSFVYVWQYNRIKLIRHEEICSP